MLTILIISIFLILPISAMINCRIACTKCRDKREHTEMLEVYCAMCQECKERRREWLQSGHLNLREDHDNHLKNYPQDLQEDCIPDLQAPCEDQLLSGNDIPTTTTSTTTTTTQPPPSSSKPPCKPKAPCAGVPCIPIMPMCAMCPVKTVTPGSYPVSSTSYVSFTSKTPESLYFYVGVPKKLLKDLKLLRS